MSASDSEFDDAILLPRYALLPALMVLPFDSDRIAQEFELVNSAHFSESVFPTELIGAVQIIVVFDLGAVM